MKGGRILGRGTNKDRNDPEFITCAPGDYGTHAEITALKSCGTTPIKGGTLYVARVGSAGDPRMSKPCPACQDALRKAGIKKVVFTVAEQMDL